MFLRPVPLCAGDHGVTDPCASKGGGGGAGGVFARNSAAPITPPSVEKTTLMTSVKNPPTMKPTRLNPEFCRNISNNGRTFSGRSPVFSIRSVSLATTGPIASVTGICSTCQTIAPMMPASSPTAAPSPVAIGVGWFRWSR